jgi:membrane-associated phospholipid phosphatase
MRRDWSRTGAAIPILVACVLVEATAWAQDAGEAGDASAPPAAEPTPDKLDDLPPIQTEEGKIIPPPPPEVPRMRAPIRPSDATRSPPDPLVDVIPIPPTDNRYGGENPAAWSPRRNIYTNTSDVIVTGAAAGVALAAAIVPPHSAHVKGGVLYDEGARDVLRISSRDGRYMARDASDVGASLMTTWPFLVDALLTAWWYRGDVKLARNMTLVAAETIVLTSAVQGVTNTVASRERPYGRLCGDAIPENTVDCEGNVRYRSFFSGHSAATFASAGVLCWNHLGLRLIGGPWDVVTCVTGYAVAASTALFRVMSDMHYATDISLGAVIGTSVGLVVPWMHLSPPIEPRPGQISVRVAPVGQGLGVTGSF